MAESGWLSSWGQGGGHFTERAQARDVHELGLQILQPRLGILPLGQVANESREEPPGAARRNLADRQFHRKGRAVLALADHDAADANDASLAGGQIMIQIAVVAAAIRLRHQHLDVAPGHLGGGPAELFFRGRAKRLDQAPLVDDDDGVGHGVEDGAQMRFALDEKFVGWSGWNILSHGPLLGGAAICSKANRASSAPCPARRTTAPPQTGQAIETGSAFTLLPR